MTKHEEIFDLAARLGWPELTIDEVPDEPGAYFAMLVLRVPIEMDRGEVSPEGWVGNDWPASRALPWTTGEEDWRAFIADLAAPELRALRELLLLAQHASGGAPEDPTETT